MWVNWSPERHLPFPKHRVDVWHINVYLIFASSSNASELDSLSSPSASVTSRLHLHYTEKPSSPTAAPRWSRHFTFCGGASSLSREKHLMGLHWKQQPSPGGTGLGSHQASCPQPHVQDPHAHLLTEIPPPTHASTSAVRCALRDA